MQRTVRVAGAARTVKQFSSLVLLAGALLLADVDRGLAAVLRFDTQEIVLRSASVYDGSHGSPNPFDVSLTARVTSPGGRIYTVDGFFDGDGAGGQVGNVFKIRVFADQAGTWSWRTESSDSGLDGQSGTFSCSGTLAGVFGQGPVVASATRPRSFRYRDGPPIYLLAKYLDRDAPVALQFSHTLFSEERSDADRQALLDRHAGMELNKINVYLANVNDYGGVATTPWLGTADASDKARFDLSRWRTYDLWTLAMRDAGFATQLWFYADGSGFGNLPDADRNRLIRYGMARLSGYVNTMFTLMTEWQEGWTEAKVHSSMEALQQHNPWDRLASVHGLPGDFSFPGASWADYMVVQTGVGTSVTHAIVHDSTLRNRALAAKPLQQEEFCLGQETLANRQMAWAAFTAGAAGTGTGAFLEPLAEFVATVPFERMAPADALVLSGAAYALAEAGQAYVFYLYDGGTISADLRGVSGTFRADWFDPRIGAFQVGAAVSGGVARSFTAPGAGDWVLRLLRDSGDPPPPPPPPPPPDGGAGFYTLMPCRLVDTRDPGDAPALVSGQVRALDLSGLCGIPASAVALSLNVTVTGPAGAGHLSFAPGGVPFPAASTINFGPGQTRANNAILRLAPDGSGVLAVQAGVLGGGSVHLILDVNGYFE